ncbi:MAG: biopolymer transporter ExbD [Myxococcales bacterium]|jgi:biopolymer transport protein ExbD|nr:biopolymer transporter ExbD [Myxococcales bacterium]
MVSLARRVALASSVALAPLAAGCGDDLVTRGTPSTAPASPATSTRIVPSLDAASASASAQPEPATIVGISKQGALSVDGVAIDERSLEDRVKRGVGASPEPRVVVAADREAPYTRVNQVVDAIKHAGSRKVSLALVTSAEPPLVKVTPAPPASVVVSGIGPSAPKTLAAPAEVGGEPWECVFPADVDRTRIEMTIITMRVLVDEGGKPADFDFVGDAPRPFAEAARTCATRRKGWVPAKDASGKTVGGWTLPFKVQFAR